ncbi:hypothetical protein Taro_020871 [Colocasia esculenta]|uniref:Uncharacterized protein n=1 Tax=Colocasia esculenta TaxID=4460 RepID=A0A843UXF4_COLES|nr:hypothetical protein [Colocasia esculenta]
MPGQTMKRLACFLVLFLLFLQVFAEASLDSGTAHADGEMLKKSHKPKIRPKIRPKINCGYACARRCSKASRKNVCMRACGTCCSRCQCVPPGTYGNTHLCPCYAGLRTRGHRPKCP